MSYEDLMERIYSAFPDLRGHLYDPQVVYVRPQGRAYITFKARVLVGEAQFLALEKEVRRAFPRVPVSLRVVSPDLKDAFFSDIGAYKQVLVDFLRRNYPCIAPWLDAIDWTARDRVITLSFPDDFSMEYMARQNIRPRLAQAVKDIFGAECRVELTVAGSAEKALENLRRARAAADEPITMAELQKRYGGRIREEKAPAKHPVPRLPLRPPAEENLVRDPLTPVMMPYPAGKAIIGRSIADRPVPIRELTADAGLVVIQGDIFHLETRELKGGETVLVTFALTDYTSSVLCKAFLYYRSRFRNKDETDDRPITDEEKKAVNEKLEAIRKAGNVKIHGECAYDNYARELSVKIRSLVPMEQAVREDNAPEKRVELHLHTNMSTMDAMTPAGDLIARAAAWGHPAIAVTDHGSVQAFPAAFSAVKGKDIKLIPGCEGYMVNEREAVEDPDDRDLRQPIVVLDFETTGLNTRTDRVIEIGAVRLEGDAVTDTFSMLVDPRQPLRQKIVEVTGITDSMLAGQETAETAIPKLLDFIGDCPIAAHNSAFDASILRSELKRLGRSWQGPVLDTLTMARKLYPQERSHKLGALCKHLGISLKNAHRAVHDAAATAQLLARMLRECEERGLHTLRSLNDGLPLGAIADNYHIILLAATQEGLVNLNRLVSISNLEYFHRRPHMPQEIIQKYRAGLIVGSACEAGELFRAVLAGEDRDRLRHIARFYDYLEIQPLGNNGYLVREGRVKDVEALRELNRTIVSLGEELGIPVCATGDVHFLDPHHAVNRAIIQAGMGYEDADNQPPLYFKTTEEMLEEFAYLGPEKAREVVITNPRRIADRVESLRLFPKHPKGEDTFQPVWETAADDIQNMSWGTAREWYGDELPEIVTKRLEKELKSIVGYGFSTLYSIAQKLVSKSNEDGYLVGSRGSVGSSFVATMCGITEVNPLPPHYRCRHCRKGYFDVDTDRYHVGMDLPDKTCPVCGQPLLKDGYDIPFEVFLGFHGDKVPDIDLNFSGEYQARAHHYVEDLFGHDHVFRAGTITGLADKTAYGYVSKYLEERGIEASGTEKDRLAQGCVGVKKTTGQHPGGMVVVPKEYEIYQFTAVQHPADDLNSDFITTHFDFNSMHDILVKLDCLGHDDPTMMHLLEQLTGVNYKDVPLDDPAVRSLFQSPRALGVTAAEIGCSTGTFGVPEFGTAFVRGMLDQTHPTTMEELIRISGLSHGTDVWLGNAADIIASGTATLSECVCCRDDIMNYLIRAGVEPKMAFTTMESVRKGRGLKPEMEQAMLEHHVAPWFLDSCKKIKYMFPKGHAVAYVTMSLRVAWYKVHYPLAYYAAYFTIRGDGYDAATMILAPDDCRAKLKELKDMKNSDESTGKTDQQITALELVLEMNMRGIRFLPADLYKSDASRFLIEDGSLRVPFASLGGLGEAAAKAIVEARKDGPFLSVEDLKDRAKISSAVVELLRQHGTLAGLSETSQMSMFGMI